MTRTRDNDPEGADQTGLYADPEIYDILHSHEVESDVEGLTRMALAYSTSVCEQQTWLEPACGTGRYLREARARDIRVVGFDIDEGMVSYAKRKLAGIESDAKFGVHIADMTGFVSDDLVRAGSIDFAFNLINTIRHLGSDKAMLRHFDQMRAALRDGGVYAVGLSRTAYGMEPATEDVWEAERGKVTVRQIVSYLPPTRGARSERVISHLVISQRGREDEHRDDTYALRSYDSSQWEALLEKAGWTIVASCDETGDEVEPSDPGYFIDILSPE